MSNFPAGKIMRKHWVPISLVKSPISLSFNPNDDTYARFKSHL